MKKRSHTEIRVENCYEKNKLENFGTSHFSTTEVSSKVKIIRRYRYLQGSSAGISVTSEHLFSYSKGFASCMFLLLV
jgi:hypothetical protein